MSQNLNARRSPVQALLLDRNNYHTFLPLLYQVAAAEVEPEQIVYPVRSILLYNLIGFRNRLFVLTNWAWDYFFYERAVRLILPIGRETGGG